MNQKKSILIVFLYSFTSILPVEENGICLTYSEGDSSSITDCNASTLKECSKGKKSISNEDTLFQSYDGKLFRSAEDQNSFVEFRKEPKSNCDLHFINSARNQEGTMSSNWGYIVYSENLKTGDKAFVYGKKVIVRESGSVKAKKLFNVDDNAEVLILEKSKAKEKVGNSFTEAFWFKVKIKDKQGWIYGQYIHPNPKSKEALGL
jgi:hypothetical protein